LTVLTLPPLWIHAMRISPSFFRFRSSRTGGGAGGGALGPVPLTLLVGFGTEDEPVLKGMCRFQQAGETMGGSFEPEAADLDADFFGLDATSWRKR
jgi:hypothetical protein